MTDDGDDVAVLHRVEEDLAALVLEANNGVVDGIVVLETDRPEAARHPAAVLHVHIDDDQLVVAGYDPDETTAHQQAAQDRVKQFADRPPTDDG